mgnify:CR=1 FL=1
MLQLKELPSISSFKYQHGFSMIELLVTVLVFSICLLGIASLQTHGLRMTRDAGLMTQASLLANNIAEKMRSNILGGACLCSLSQTELSDWNKNIQSFLPNGLGVVNSLNQKHTITITWTESQDSLLAQSQRSYELVVRI